MHAWIWFGLFVAGCVRLDAALMLVSAAGWFALETVACVQPARVRYRKEAETCQGQSEWSARTC